MRWWPWGRKPETRAVDWFSFGFEAPFQANASGMAVTSTSVLGLSAAYACVRLLADTIATLPVEAFQRVGETRKPVDPPGWLQEPGGGPWVGPIDLLNQVMASLLLDGNAYLLTPRDGGEVTGLVALDPGSVSPQPGDVYSVMGEELGRDELLHVRGLVRPGLAIQRQPVLGISPVGYAREAFGAALATQQFGAAFFGNGAWPGVIAEVPGQLSDTGQKALKAAWNEVHRGAGNAHKLGVLTEGAKLNKLTISPEDAQFLQTRQFQVAEVARMYGVPPHLVGDASGSTSWGSGLAEQNTAFGQYTLRPWVERIDAAFTRLWRSEGAPPDFFVKLNLDGKLRGTTRDRYEAYQVGLAAGFLTVNEVRALEDLPPLEEGGGDAA